MKKLLAFLILVTMLGCETVPLPDEVRITACGSS